MEDPCKNLREKAAEALAELTDAGEAMAEYSVIQPYTSGAGFVKIADHLRMMREAFEREQRAWDAYYQINLELLDCIRKTYRERQPRDDQ